MNREIKFRGKDKKPCDLEPTKTTGTVEAMLSCVETAFNQRMNSMKTINEVKLAEKNTPLGRFQKERTDAISEMFDNVDDIGIYPTSRFFVRLDNCFQKELERIAKELVGGEMEHNGIIKAPPELNKVIIPYGYNQKREEIKQILKSNGINI
jgi:hypothetical protein